jgi:hypothetical protein
VLGPFARDKPRFDPDTLSSVWVMACRDESPVLTAFSVAYRLGDGTTPAEVMELVKGRRELFRLGLTPAQSRAWKERYRQQQQGQAGGEAGGEAGGDAAAAPERKPPGLPDWLRVFDDEGPQADQDRVREWLGEKGISSSGQALERFLDKGFVIDESVIRSQFRADHELKAEPSDLATVNWGLEHIERLRRGRAETRQQLVALTTGIGGVAIGALVALTAPMVTTLYQGRPLDTNRLTIHHQKLLDGYGELGTAVAAARRAARAGDGRALADALTDLDRAATWVATLVPDQRTRDSLRQARARASEACATLAPPAGGGAPCPAALDDLQRLLDGPLAEVVAR